ncbi:MAG TPA: sensor domain-containing protein [Gaiellaceae bacterium]
MKADTRPPSFARTVLHPFVERRTYLALLYSLLGLPLGIFYFVFIVTGLGLGLGLLITLVGIPILVLTLLCCRGLAQLERTLAASLLDAPMPRVGSSHEEGLLWRRLVSQLRSADTWREVGYLLIRFPIGIASFSIAVTVVAAGIQYGLVLPFLVAFVPSAGPDFGSWSVDTVGRALLFVPPGLALLLFAPTILNALGRVERSLATSFLGRIPRADFRHAIARALARGETDALGLLGDLELYIGRGPYVTPTRLEANLLALEDLGLVAAKRDGASPRYHLTAEGQKALARL